MSSRAAQNIKRWREDPLAFVVEVFGITPDPWQAEGLRNFPTQRRQCFKACKGPGKTAYLAWVNWNFLLTRPHPNMAATSITEANLKTGFWKEMAKWQLKSKMLQDQFSITSQKIFNRKFPDTWRLDARPFAKSSDATSQALALAGLHSDYLMFTLDEAGGIPDAVSATAEAGLATGIETRLVMCGNPTHLSGPLYSACTSRRHLWDVLEITGDPDDPNRSPRIDIQWARDQIDQYGRDNPFVLVNVFGQFPPSSLNTLFGVEEVTEAQNRRFDKEAIQFSQRRLGVDTARFGDDRTVLYYRQGKYTKILAQLRNQRTQDIAARVMKEVDEHHIEAIFVDDTGGYGAGVIDMLGTMGLNPIPVNFSGKADDPRYYNKRAEMWFRMSEWVKKGGCLEKNSEHQREFCAITYSYQNDRLLLEDKKILKARLGYSPDLADALGLTFATPDLPTGDGWDPLRRQSIRNSGIKYDYDPLGEDAWND